jgi:hypothetical protein
VKGLAKRRKVLYHEQSIQQASGQLMFGAGYINIGQDTELLQQTELSFLLVTPRRTYSIYSDSAADVRGWLDVLEKAIARAKGLV